MSTATRSTRRPAQEENGRRRSLVRNCHIFESAVREVLGLQPLRLAGESSLTLGQLHLLRLICRDGLRQLGAAADFLGVSAPAATKTIDKLVEHGLVVRKPSSTDRRVQVLSASPKGRRLAQRFEAHRDARLERALAAFQPEEVNLFATMLQRFAVSLYGAGEVDGGFCLRCASEVAPQCPVADLRGGCPYQQAQRSDRAEPRDTAGP